jgi:LytS/YehU family sensor histidine kinase
MTPRLARVFHHALANSAHRPIPLQEEVEFLETYLQIEEARFGKPASNQLNGLFVWLQPYERL